MDRGGQMKAVGDGDDFVPCVLTRKEKVTIQWSRSYKAQPGERFAAAQSFNS